VNRSLWHTRLFAPKNSRDASLAAALSLVNGGKVDLNLEESSEFMSAFEAIMNKDVHCMLDNVQQLYTAIKSDDDSVLA